MTEFITVLDPKTSVEELEESALYRARCAGATPNGEVTGLKTRLNDGLSILIAFVPINPIKLIRQDGAWNISSARSGGGGRGATMWPPITQSLKSRKKQPAHYVGAHY